MAEAAVVKKESTAVANIMDDLYEAAGQGMETIGADDMQIPFLRILQPLSPQLIKTDPKFIKGASAGDIFNTVTGDYWDCLLYTSPSPRDATLSRMPSSA